LVNEVVTEVAMRPALIIIDHGSRQQAANRLVVEVAAGVRTRRPQQIVEHAHMEMASPTLGDAVLACRRQGAERILILPYFLAPGLHTRETIPACVAQQAARHPDLEFEIGEPLGVHDKLIDVLLERANVPCDSEANGPAPKPKKA
jgi:sirohydrochlorin ferrochelatase